VACHYKFPVSATLCGGPTGEREAFCSHHAPIAQAEAEQGLRLLRDAQPFYRWVAVLLPEGWQFCRSRRIAVNAARRLSMAAATLLESAT